MIVFLQSCIGIGWTTRDRCRASIDVEGESEISKSIFSSWSVSNLGEEIPAGFYNIMALGAFNLGWAFKTKENICL